AAPLRLALQGALPSWLPPIPRLVEPRRRTTGDEPGLPAPVPIRTPETLPWSACTGELAGTWETCSSETRATENESLRCEVASARSEEHTSELQSRENL